MVSNRLSDKASFFVLEGIDGAGKTAVSVSVAQKLNRANAVYCSKKEVSCCHPYVEATMRTMASLLWPGINVHLDQALLAPEYWLHLQVSWYTLHNSFVVEPRLRADETLIVDGWYYKFVARMLTRHFEYEHLNALFSHLRRPDGVVLLDVDAETAWNRGRSFEPSEMGLHHRYPELGRASFVHYQSQVSNKLRTIAKMNNWTVVSVKADDSVEETSALVQSHLERLSDGSTHEER